MAFYRCLFTPGSRYRRPALLVNNLVNKQTTVKHDTGVKATQKHSEIR